MTKLNVFLASLMVIGLMAGCGGTGSAGVGSGTESTGVGSETVTKTDQATNAEPVFGDLKLGSRQADGQVQLLFDDLLWISASDHETLLKYGYINDIDEDLGYDYMVHNEVEEWVPYLTLPETTFRIRLYDFETYTAEFIDADLERFIQHISDGYAIPVNVVISSGYIYSVEEIYIP